jgi:hypothetical protein
MAIPKQKQKGAAGLKAGRAKKASEGEDTTSQNLSNREGTKNRTWRQPSKVMAPVPTPPRSIVTFYREIGKVHKFDLLRRNS